MIQITVTEIDNGNTQLEKSILEAITKNVQTPSKNNTVIITYRKGD